MPTYNAAGVAATLGVCDLRASLTNVFDKRQGAEQKADADRVQKVFSGARKLQERVIGEDGSLEGVLQFIGADADMALYMVEASERTSPPRSMAAPSDRCLRLLAPLQASDLPTFSSDSPLTPLGKTPSPVLRSDSAAQGKTMLLNPSPMPPDRGEDRESKTIASNHVSQSRFESMHELEQRQALTLDVELMEKCFYPGQASRGRGASKDLKIEVFVNGELVDVAFVSSRRSAMGVAVNSMRFSGIRVHRQVEKPLVYDMGSDLNVEGEDGNHKWMAVSSKLIEEARLRGHERTHKSSISAEFLVALAALGLPDRISHHPRFGVIDVIVTAGRGRKYGPETAYLTKPTRMDDPELIAALEQSSIPQVDDANPDPPTPVPLTTLSREGSSPMKSIELVSELGLAADSMKTFSRFENARGDVVGRSLGRRLGDVKKMSPARKEGAMKELRELFGTSEPVAKKVKIGSVSGNANDVSTASQSTIDPLLLRMDTPQLPEGAEPEALLAQERIDMALDCGAASDGHLLRRIASSSPQLTPVRRTKASALTSSPTRVPVKLPKLRGPKPTTPQKRTEVTAEGSPVPEVRKDVTPGANRTSKTWEPAERTVEDSLKAFVIPDVCVGSTVSYAADEKVYRQLGKARGGQFKEETLVVGMRFLVV